jgi:Xaa-Pro aminopeptidase
MLYRENSAAFRCTVPYHPCTPVSDLTLHPDADVFRARRERLLATMPEGVLVLPAAPELYKSRDTDVRYRPDSDLFYLSGFPEPEAVLVLTPFDAEQRFTLFVRPRDPEREVWNGFRYGVDGARERFGADAVYPIGELDERLAGLVEPAERILYPLGASAAFDRRILALVERFRRTRPRSGKGPWVVEDPGVRLGEMRLIKDDHEIAAMKKAAEVSAAGHRAAMAAARPGVGEWAVEAALEGAFRSAGARGPAFPSIVGSGPNATTLHYVSNDRMLESGDLVLVDAGAEWGMYCGDITRTFPASGRFSEPQRVLYEVVLAAEEAAIAAIGPGAPFSAVHDAAVRVLVAGMVENGLLAGEVDELIESGAYRRFYMHQTSHWLGLDVHDVGPYSVNGESVTLRPGMVLTVEPGIYISADAEDVPERFRGIGIRIEDDVLVTDAGHEVLTRAVPVGVEEVENIVGQGARPTG